MRFNEKHTDEELFQAIWGDDGRAFEILYIRYYEMLCRYAYGVIQKADDTEDLVDECFTKLWETRHYLRIEKSFRSYMLGYVHNKCLNYLRSHRVRLNYIQQREYEIAQSLTMKPFSGEDPFKQLSFDQLSEAVKTAINALPEQCRKVFEQSRFYHKTYPEIAEELGLSLGTVRTQMSRAFEKLRGALKDFL